MKATTKTAKRHARRKPARTKEAAASVRWLNNWIKLMEKAEQYLDQHVRGIRPFMPDTAAVLQAARDFSAELNPGPARASQQLVRNVISILDEHADATLPAEHRELRRTGIVELLDGAFRATEELSVRAGFLLGMARGCRFALPGAGGPLDAKAGASKS